MSNEQLLIDKALSFLPTYTSDELRKSCERELKYLISETEEEIINTFCEKHDLCPMCITGGWNCGSDHK